MRRWPYTFLVILSAMIGLAAIVLSQRLGVPLRDPEGFLGPAYVRLPVLAFLFFALGIVPQGIRRNGFRNTVASIKTILREEWNGVRVLNIMMTVISGP